MWKNKLMLGLVCFVVSTVFNLKRASAELVFDEEVENAAEVEKSIAEEKAGKLSKAENLRRHRMRAELKNEDLLTQKLEELRLKEEMKRTEELLAQKTDLSAHPQAVAMTMTSPPVQEQAVGSFQQEQSATVANAQIEAELKNQAVDSEATEQTHYSFIPKVGLSGITSSNYDLQSQYSFGLGVQVDLIPQLVLAGSYTFSNYTLGAGKAVYFPMGFNANALQRLGMDDHLVDIGLRWYAMKGTKVKPFIGAGLAYRRGFVNYDARTQAYVRQFDPIGAQDVQIIGMANTIELGLDVELSKRFALTGSFKYFNMLTSRQSSPLNPNAFVNPNTAMYYQNYGPLSDINGNKTSTSTELSGNNFYQLMFGVMITL